MQNIGTEPRKRGIATPWLIVRVFMTWIICSIILWAIVASIFSLHDNDLTVGLILVIGSANAAARAWFTREGVIPTTERAWGYALLCAAVCCLFIFGVQLLAVLAGDTQLKTQFAVLSAYGMGYGMGVGAVIAILIQTLPIRFGFWIWFMQMAKQGHPKSAPITVDKTTPPPVEQETPFTYSMEQEQRKSGIASPLRIVGIFTVCLVGSFILLQFILWMLSIKNTTGWAVAIIVSAIVAARAWFSREGAVPESARAWGYALLCGVATSLFFSLGYFLNAGDEQLKAKLVAMGISGMISSFVLETLLIRICFWLTFGLMEK